MEAGGRQEPPSPAAGNDRSAHAPVQYWHSVLAYSTEWATSLWPDETACCLLPCVLTLQDLKNIEAGLYKLPWDMTTVTHRQYNPFFMIRR